MFFFADRLNASNQHKNQLNVARDTYSAFFLKTLPHIGHSMSCNFAAETHFHTVATKNLIMKPLKDELDCDHISESNYEERPHALTFKKSNSSGANEDSDNEVPNVHQNHHPLVHHLRSNMKLESALLEYNEGLNLINKPNSNINDDNNNTSSNNYCAATSNDNNNNTTSSIKGDAINKANRKLFECDVCNVSS